MILEQLVMYYRIKALQINGLSDGRFSWQHLMNYYHFLSEEPSICHIIIGDYQSC